VPSPDLSRFTADYWDLLAAVGRRASEIDVRQIGVHWPHVGSAHRGLVLIGQALHGWNVHFPPSDFADPARRQAILTAAAAGPELPEPLWWVPKHPRVRRSSFWTFARHLADGANPGPEPWYARLAWWNVYPLAPVDPEGNPWGALKEAQERLAGRLIADIAATFGFERLVLVPGRLRLPRAEPAGLTELATRWPIFASGRIDGRTWVVGEHPGWASRRHVGSREYAALVVAHVHRIESAG
jgi:hypothetical protein